MSNSKLLFYFLLFGPLYFGLHGFAENMYFEKKFKQWQQDLNCDLLQSPKAFKFSCSPLETARTSSVHNSAGLSYGVFKKILLREAARKEILQNECLIQYIRAHILNAKRCTQFDKQVLFAWYLAKKAKMMYLACNNLAEYKTKDSVELKGLGFSKAQIGMMSNPKFESEVCTIENRSLLLQTEELMIATVPIVSGVDLVKGVDSIRDLIQPLPTTKLKGEKQQSTDLDGDGKLSDNEIMVAPQMHLSLNCESESYQKGPVRDFLVKWVEGRSRINAALRENYISQNEFSSDEKEYLNESGALDNQLMDWYAEAQSDDDRSFLSKIIQCKNIEFVHTVTSELVEIGTETLVLRNIFRLPQIFNKVKSLELIARKQDRSLKKLAVLKDNLKIDWAAEKNNLLKASIPPSLYHAYEGSFRKCFGMDEFAKVKTLGGTQGGEAFSDVTQGLRALPNSYFNSKSLGYFPAPAAELNLIPACKQLDGIRAYNLAAEKQNFIECSTTMLMYLLPGPLANLMIAPSIYQEW